MSRVLQYFRCNVCITRSAFSIFGSQPLPLQLGVPHLTQLASRKVVGLEAHAYNVVVNDSSPIIFARPKSANFTDNSLSTRRIFSGLISRCTILRSCYGDLARGLEGGMDCVTRYFIPWKSWMKTFRVSSSANLCFITIQLNNSPSAANSRTK